MAFGVIYDACVLYPNALRDLLVRLGQTDLVRARWTDAILDECFAAILKTRPELKERLSRTRQLMNAAIRDVLVTGYEDLIGGLKLPDEKDRHVLAAAIRSGSQVIVTFNLRHFPDEALEPFQVEAQHPDVFVRHLIDIDAGVVLRALKEMAASTSKPAQSPDGILDILEKRHGLADSASALREEAKRRGVSLSAG